MYDAVFWTYVLGIVLAGLALAFVSAIEAALVSVNEARLHQLIEQGHPTAPLVRALVSRPQELLGGLIVMVNVLVLLIANLTTAAALRNWGPQSVAGASLVMLILTLLFGEIVPKTLSVHFAERIALRTARFTAALSFLMSPIVTVVTGISMVLLGLLIGVRILRGRLRAAPTAFSEEDIKQLITAGEQSGEVEAAEREMLHGAIEFADTAAYEIMVPRTDLVALPADATIAEAIETFMSSGHSRVPVYEDNADNILGLLYIKDLLIRLNAAEEAGEVAPATLTGLLRPAYFVPESKKSDELLREMQRRQVHMAIVVDEYGGTAGIITIEDLLEEIVGDIIDEYDKERLEVMPMPDGSVAVLGRASLEKVHDELDVPIPEESEAETISGLITEILGRIPEVGDQVTVGGVRFTVVEVAHNRVEQLRAVILPSEGPPTTPTA